MTVHFFTFSDAQGGSSRQRAFRVVDELNRRGMHAIIHQPPVLMLSRTRWPKKARLILQMLRSLFLIKKGDVVYLQRAIANKYFFVIMAAYLFVFRRTMIFDFDDPVYLHSYLKTKTFCRMADAVITCTHEQAKWARQFNRNVHVIHIALDLAAYEKFTKDYSVPVVPATIGWVGTGPEHLYNLQTLAVVFERLLAQGGAPFTFTLIGSLKNQKVYDVFRNVRGLDVKFIDALNWADPQSVPQEIQKFDIGVVPHRSDGEWNKAKTSFKVLEYMACGVATIVSAFGEMSHIIRDGENGCVADGENEWVEKLQILLANPEFRARIGKAGQERVREAYCFDAIVPRIMGVINDLGRAPSQLHP